MRLKIPANAAYHSQIPRFLWLHHKVSRTLLTQVRTATSTQSYGNFGLDVAEKRHLLALAIDMELGDRSGIAAGFQSLGNVAFRRGDLEGAEECWLPALAIAEEAGDRAHLAKVYLDQGMLALVQKDPGSAEGWCRRSLAIYEELGDQFAMAVICAQLGLLAGRQGRQAEALAWAVRCVTLFGETSHSPARIGRRLLADFTNEFGMDALETAWREVTGDELPGAVRDYVNDQTQEEGAGNDR
jgi:tetratricopeptide (TPR) repeat protein